MCFVCVKGMCLSGVVGKEVVCVFCVDCCVWRWVWVWVYVCGE